jgi:hypothetical protein
MIKNNNNEQYVRKKTSTLLALSAIALLLSSPLLLVNLLLQPAQAQTTLSFRTVGQASGRDPNSGQQVGLTFDAHGTSNTSDPTRVDITSGTIQQQIDPSSNGTISSGKINYGTFDNRTGREFITFDATIDNRDYSVQSFCSTSEGNEIQLTQGEVEADLYGPVECSSSSQGGGGNTASPSQTTGTTTAQDSDGDGIPDSSDRCDHNSHHRCFKEEDASTTTTSTDQQPSSSSSSGNQTR